MLIDKIRDSGGGVLLKELPAKYFKGLQIPKTMYKLLSDVTRILLDGSGITKAQLDSIISRFDQKEYKGMFEGVIEGYRKSYQKGYKSAKTRYLKYRDQSQQYQEQLRQMREEIRRLREQLAGKA
jgi:flagellar biosynthesis/type III secretory pathway protein FliH